MHICFASLDYPDEIGGGGVGTYVKTISHEMIERGHRVSVIALRKDKELSDRSNDKGVNIHWITPGNMHWYVSKVPFIGRFLALPVREIEYSNAVLNAIRTIDQEEPLDVVEGTETGAYYFSRLRPGIKKIIRLHGEAYTFAKYTPPGRIPMNITLSRYLQRKALLQVDLLTSPSYAHADEMKSELGAQGISIKVLPNPLSEDFFSVEREIPNADHPVFLYVGRLQTVKGIIPLLRAIPQVVKKKPGSRFILAGKDHPSLPKAEMEKLITELDITKAVEFLGHVPLEKLNLYYQKATAVILPSYYESFGYACLEAVMHGIPVVAVSTGIARDLIVEGKNGFFVQAGDSEALAMACLQTVSMHIDMPDQKTLDRYSVARVCREIAMVYNELRQQKIINFYLSPHFDDVVFSCGGLIYEQIRQGQDALVVTIFGGTPDYSRIGSFARAIHKKWKSQDPVSLRRVEDMKAVETLGAKLLQLDFLDCIYRQNKDNAPLYNDYESMKGIMHPNDNNLVELIYDRIVGVIQQYKHKEFQVFAPLGVGNHVDHQIVKIVGLRLLSKGYNVFFYEEIPYCLWYPEGLQDVIAKNENEWSSKIFSIDIKAKLNSIKPYNSQFAGLGGSFRSVGKRFKKYAAMVGKGKFAERVWFFKTKK